MNLFDLHDRTALITGSARGVGKVLAHSLASYGATVVLNDINQDRLDETVKEFEKQNFDVYSSLFDVTNETDIKSAVELIIKKHAKIDVLVNNAGINRRAPILELQERDWDAVLKTNLKSVFLVSRNVVPYMIKNGHGKIINIASLTSEGARPTIAAYTASKGGVKMLTKSMAVEWASKNIQVNGIGPGYFKTEMNTALVEDPKFNEWVLSQTPAKRWGELSDLAGTVVFLASSASDFINGQIIYVDGGWLASL